MRFRRPVGVERVRLLGAVVCCLAAGAAGAQELSARAVVDRQEAFVGETLQLQIQVEGSEKPERPDLAGLAKLTVRDLGGRRNSSHSVSIVNGRVSRQVQRGYIFSYAVTPTAAGRIVIPSIPVTVEGKVVETRPVVLNVREPQGGGDFHLRMELSKSVCYVGEAVTLTLTWYLGQDVQGFEFHVPALTNAALTYAEPRIDVDDGQRYYRIPVGGDEVLGRKGTGRWDGKTYTTISFSKLAIPVRPGRVELAPASVLCEALVGYRRERQRSMLDDFLGGSPFGSARRGVYSRRSVRSNGLSLEVQPLPAADRPAGFAGHVGRFDLSATAAPTRVHVGDPITLTLRLTGPPHLERLTLPPLAEQPALAADFRIPADMSPGTFEGGAKMFTQTIRALHDEVERIPPIELPYFDPEAQAFRVARTDPIPITVEPTRVVTAGDAEGAEPVVAPGRALEAWSRGIAYNYEGPGVLRDQRYGWAVWSRAPVRLAACVVPPLFYGALLCTVFVRRRRSGNPAALRARRAFATAAAGLKASGGDEAGRVLTALRGYVGDKLGVAAGALTFADARGALLRRGVGEDTIAELGRLFERCEAGRYAGGAAAGGADSLADRALAVMRRMEKRLR